MAYADGSLGAGFKIQGIDITCADDAEINEVTGRLQTLLNTAHEGLKLQVYYDLRSDFNDLFSQHEGLFKNAPEVYKPVLKSRLDFFRENQSKGKYFRPEITLYIRSAPYVYGRQGLLTSEEKFRQMTREEYDKHRGKFLRSIEQVRSSLEEVGLGVQSLSETEWLKRLYEHFNLSRSKKHGPPTLKAHTSAFADVLSGQFLLTDIFTERDHIEIGEYKFRTITLKTLPDGETFASMIEKLLLLPFHFKLVQGIEVLDQKKEIERLEVQRRLALSMASDGNVKDLESESKLEAIEELLRELHEGVEKLVSIDLTMLIWSKTPEGLDRKADEVLRAYRELNQAEGLVETLAGMDAFLGAAPGACKGLRKKKLKTSNAAHLMPIFSYWPGNDEPASLFQGRDGNLTKISLFDPSLSNWNGIIFGTTGGGKSFTLNQLILQFYGHHSKPRVVWVDNGASSQNLVEALGGSFIPLTIDSGIRINPFDLDQGETRPTPNKVKLILAVLESIFRESDQEGLRKRDKAFLEESIYKLYDECQDTPTLTDLKRYLDSHGSKTLRDYGQILYSWTGSTAYGRMLDGKTNVQLDKDLVTIETKGLDDYPELQNVFLLLLTDHIKREAAADFETPYLLLIDEAWKLFESPSGKAFALEAYRTFRKFNAGIFLISQNYLDFLSSPDLARAILPNTAHTFIMRQAKIDWKNFKERLGLNDAQLRCAKGLKQQKGVFSEVFYLQGDRATILRIISDRLGYWLSTSRGKDRAKIMALEGNHPDLSRMQICQLLAREAS